MCAMVFIELYDSGMEKGEKSLQICYSIDSQIEVEFKQVFVCYTGDTGVCMTVQIQSNNFSKQNEKFQDFIFIGSKEQSVRDKRKDLHKGV